MQFNVLNGGFGPASAKTVVLSNVLDVLLLEESNFQGITSICMI